MPHINELPDTVYLLASPNQAETNGGDPEPLAAVFGGYEMFLVWPNEDRALSWQAGAKDPAEIVSMGWSDLVSLMDHQGIKAAVYNLEPGEGVKATIPEERIVWRR